MFYKLDCSMIILTLKSLREEDAYALMERIMESL